MREYDMVDEGSAYEWDSDDEEEEGEEEGDEEEVDSDEEVTEEAVDEEGDADRQHEDDLDMAKAISASLMPKPVVKPVVVPKRPRKELDIKGLTSKWVSKLSGEARTAIAGGWAMGSTQYAWHISVLKVFFEWRPEYLTAQRVAENKRNKYAIDVHCASLGPKRAQQFLCLKQLRWDEMYACDRLQDSFNPSSPTSSFYGLPLTQQHALWDDLKEVADAVSAALHAVPSMEETQGEALSEEASRRAVCQFYSQNLAISTVALKEAHVTRKKEPMPGKRKAATGLRSGQAKAARVDGGAAVSPERRPTHQQEHQKGAQRMLRIAGSLSLDGSAAGLTKALPLQSLRSPSLAVVQLQVPMFLRPGGLEQLLEGCSVVGVGSTGIGFKFGSGTGEFGLSEHCQYMQIIRALQNKSVSAVMHRSCTGDDVGMAGFHLAAKNATLPQDVLDSLCLGSGMSLALLRYTLKVSGHNHINWGCVNALGKHPINHSSAGGGAVAASASSPSTATAVAATLPTAPTSAAAFTASMQACIGRMLMTGVVKHAANGTGTVTCTKARNHSPPDCINKLEEIAFLGASYRAAVKAGKDMRISTKLLTDACELFVARCDSLASLQCTDGERGLQGRGGCRVLASTASRVTDQLPGDSPNGRPAGSPAAPHSKSKGVEPGSPGPAPSPSPSAGSHFFTAKSSNSKSSKLTKPSRRATVHNAKATSLATALLIEADRDEKQTQTEERTANGEPPAASIPSTSRRSTRITRGSGIAAVVEQVPVAGDHASSPQMSRSRACAMK